MNTRSANGKLPIVRYVEEDEDEQMTVAPRKRGDISDDESSPPMKRRKSQSAVKSSHSSRTSTPKGKSTKNVEKKLYRGRNAGKLAKMLEMPVEIFCEISGYLEPLDILHLARSSRPFNDMLMSRNSKPIWRMARRRLAGFPDCPPDLSEPAYASLIFEKNCHVCLASRVLKVDYTLRVRLCHRCRSTNIVRGAQLLKSIPGLTAQLLDCVPCRKRACRRNRASQYFYTGQVKSLMTEFHSTIPRDIPEKEAQPLRKEFYDKKKELLEIIADHAGDVEHWVNMSSFAKQDEGVQASCRREASLRARLIELGHDEEDFPNNWEDDEWANILAQPRDLTPRIWTKVKPKLEACIQRTKQARIERDRAFRREWRRQELSPFVTNVISDRREQDKELSMSTKDVFLLPSVAALFEADDYQQTINQEVWNASWSQIEKEMDAFAESARRHLIGLIRTSLPDSPDQGSTSQVLDSPPLSKSSSEDGVSTEHEMEALRSAYFHCKSCYQHAILKYPALLDHSHPLKEMVYDDASTKYASLLFSSFSGTQREDELYTELVPRLQCLLCGENTRCMSWTQLIIHFKLEQEWYDGQVRLQQSDPSLAYVTMNNDHALNDESPPVFAVVDTEEAYAVGNKLHSIWDQFPDMKCALCGWPKGQARSKIQVESHIRRNHLKEPQPEDLKKTPGRHI